jgi:2-polyprenyl-6-methoxyphenol hydroxylase-like FAD-dependent oxidoreductase
MITSRPKRSIAIAGGGIGGLTAALALARTGNQVTVFEQAPALQEIGAGIQMGPNAFKLFELLGLRSQIDPIAVFPDRYQINDLLTGEQLTHIPYGQTCIDRFGHPYGVVHRHDLHSILADACRAAGVEIVLGFRLLEFEQTSDGVLFRSHDGRSAKTDALLGADGIRSAVRAQMMKDESDPVSQGIFAARAVLRIDEIPEELRHARITIWLGPNCHAICYPLRAGELFNLAAVFESSSDPTSPDWNMQRELDRAFADITPAIKPLLARLEDTIYRAATERVPISKWSDGFVGLLGDAAHAMTQNLAQGGCMAIEDALVLAESLNDNPGDTAAALELYTQRRAPRTVRVQYVARMMGDVLHLKGAEREARNQLLRAREPGDNLEFFAWLYEGVDIHEETAAHLR